MGHSIGFSLPLYVGAERLMSIAVAPRVTLEVRGAKELEFLRYFGKKPGCERTT